MLSRGAWRWAGMCDGWLGASLPWREMICCQTAMRRVFAIPHAPRSQHLVTMCGALTLQSVSYAACCQSTLHAVKHVVPSPLSTPTPHVATVKPPWPLATQEMVLPRFLEANGVASIVCPTACGYTARVHPSGPPEVLACSLLPRYSTSLGAYMQQHAEAGTLIPEATAVLAANSLLRVGADLRRLRVLHK